MVDDGYVGLDFPFPELPYPRLLIERRWDLAGFLGYLSTWSAVRKAREAGREDVVTAFVEDWRALWGDPARERRLVWPIAMRLGEISSPA
jgi:hypothetical protein